MEVKEYLTETFKFNDKANRKVLEIIKTLPEKDECIKLFSHLINCMYRWMTGVRHQPDSFDWWDPVYPLEKLEDEWGKSLQLWIDYLSEKTDEEIGSEIKLLNFSGGNWAMKPLDIALQLNYHSIHHRGQIQYIIRKQGFKPNYIEYIGDKYRKIEVN